MRKVPWTSPQFGVYSANLSLYIIFPSWWPIVRFLFWSLLTPQCKASLCMAKCSGMAKRHNSHLRHNYPYVIVDGRECLHQLEDNRIQSWIRALPLRDEKAHAQNIPLSIRGGDNAPLNYITGIWQAMHQTPWLANWQSWPPQLHTCHLTDLLINKYSMTKMAVGRSRGGFMRGSLLSFRGSRCQLVHVLFAPRVVTIRSLASSYSISTTVHALWAYPLHMSNIYSPGVCFIKGH